MIALGKYRVLTFDCYGTLIDWETGISNTIVPWLQDLTPRVPVELVISCFAVMQAKHQQVRPALPYPEVLGRTWRDIEQTFGWNEDPTRAAAFCTSIASWPPFADTIGSLRYLRRFFKLAILSNVDNASLARTLRLMEVSFDFTVTAEDVGSYKPALPHFERALGCLADMGIDKDEVLHVAQSKHHDVNPCRQLGLTCAWVNRRHGRTGTGATLAADADPDLTVTSLAELVNLHEQMKSQSDGAVAQ